MFGVHVPALLLLDSLGASLISSRRGLLDVVGDLIEVLAGRVDEPVPGSGEPLQDVPADAARVLDQFVAVAVGRPAYSPASLCRRGQEQPQGCGQLT